jgi:hypothetical protein
MTGTAPVATRTGELYAYGRRSWAEVRALLEGCTAVWGDLDGMHLAEPLPSQAPAYTHLWAWHGPVYARVRSTRARIGTCSGFS